ncbi:type II toxin-antitoxin system Phd/YefM family antitoxin [Pseudonocardia sp. TRM90224]|uniref:type II toxin-antitoxin system Phd/YefM family antitoxin n=1 Tax=Pseudonocardia sp. TRM90224 TaxID=2812678 RepID=UPI0035A906E1
MPRTISQRELRNDNAEIMRSVEAGESFTVTRNGKPIADIVPHAGVPAKRRMTFGELQKLRQSQPPVDVGQWYADRAADDVIFGDDRIEY